MSREVICPVCSQPDQVEKVSTIYVTGIGLNRTAAQQNSAAPHDTAVQGGSPEVLQDLSEMPALLGFSPAELKTLSRRLKPPSTGKRDSFRALHPDLVVLTFSLVIPFFLFGVLTSQESMLPAMLVLLAGFYGFYFWKRKSLIAKFEKQRSASTAANRRAEQSVGRWMKLFYCARDDCVFVPGTGNSVPADQMPGYLFQVSPGLDE